MHKLFKFPQLNLGIITILTIFFGIQLPNVVLDNDVKKFLPEDHIVNNEIDREEEIFGSTEIMVVALENTKGTIFSKEFIEQVGLLTTYAEGLEGVDSVDSLTNTDYVKTIPGGMDVSPLVDEDFTGTPEDLEELKMKLLSWDIYSESLYSQDFKATQLAITMIRDLDAEKQEKIYFDLKEYMSRNIPDWMNTYLAGNPSVLTLISVYMKKDLQVLIPLVIVVLIFFLFVFFKKPGGVFLPLTSVLISTVWTLGIMALFHIPLSVVSTAIPVLMVAVGSAYGIHVVSHYYDELRHMEGKIDHEIHTDLVKRVLKSVGIPVLTASLTTIAGFASLGTSHIVPLRYFGLFTALGVCVAMVVSLLLIPSLLIMKNHSKGLLKKGASSQKKRKHSATETTFSAVSRFLSENNIRMIVFFIGVICLSLYGIDKLIVDNSLIEYFKEDSEIRQAEKYMSKHFLGTETFSIIVEGKRPGDMAYPVVLNSINTLTEYLHTKYDVVSKVTSFSDFVMRMNQVMNDPAGNILDEADPAPSSDSEEDWSGFSSFSSFLDEDTETTEEPEPVSPAELSAPAYDLDETLTYDRFCDLLQEVWVSSQSADLSATDLIQGIWKRLNKNGAYYNEIPSDPAKYNLRTQKDLQNLISQYLLVFSGNLDQYADDGIEPQIIRIAVTLKTTGSRLPHEIMKDVEQYAASHFPEDTTIWTSGTAKAKFAVTELIVGTQIRSIIISLILVFIIVTIQFRSLPIGLISIIPLTFSILINFGVMGLFGIKLDIGTAIVSSIAIGIGVDYTIHFLTGYFQIWKSEKEPEHSQVVEKLWLTVGKAIIFNALSVAAGFFVLVFSNFNPLMYLGILVVLTMLTSSLGALTVLPAIIRMVNPSKLYKEKK